MKTTTVNFQENPVRRRLWMTNGNRHKTDYAMILGFQTSAGIEWLAEAHRADELCVIKDIVWKEGYATEITFEACRQDEVERLVIEAKAYAEEAVESYCDRLSLGRHMRKFIMPWKFRVPMSLERRKRIWRAFRLIRTRVVRAAKTLD